MTCNYALDSECNVNHLASRLVEEVRLSTDLPWDTAQATALSVVAVIRQSLRLTQLQVRRLNIQYSDSRVA